MAKFAFGTTLPRNSPQDNYRANAAVIGQRMLARFPRSPHSEIKRFIKKTLS